jgi:glucosamine-phosphate N-acetyltransferase
MTKKIEYEVRELTAKLLEKNLASFFATLENLRKVGDVKKDRARKILALVNTQGGKIFVACKSNGEIVGVTTLIIEQKFIRAGGKVGHVEDVAIKKGYERMGIGSALVKKAVEKAKKQKCYKVILDCLDKNVSFYKKSGFKLYGNSMRLDLSR